MPTIFKHTHNQLTATRIALPNVVQAIRDGSYAKPLQEFRSFCATASRDRSADGSYRIDAPWEQAVPRICFAADYLKRQGAMHLVAYNGLVMLEVSDLSSHGAAVSIRTHAGQLPQTLLTFVGADGRSVVIVCRAELLPDKRPQDSVLPTGDEATLRFHQHAYAKAQLFYAAELGMPIEKMAPPLDRICYLSADASLCYNPDALPFYADTDAPAVPSTPYQHPAGHDEAIPGFDPYAEQVYVIEACLAKAHDESLGISDEQERHVAVLKRHARYCMESAIPMALALRITLYDPQFSGNRMLVQKIFDNVYTPSAMRKAVQGNPATAHLRHIPKSTLLMLHTNAFMQQQYQFRKNELTGVAQFRPVAWPYLDFRDVTEEDRNTITRRALDAGLESWDVDIRRYIESSDIPLYNPLDDYLAHLPKWDGRDRLSELARRVPTADDLWHRFFPVWMRSMVAHWQGLDRLHGNSLVPLLIGPQGCGKTTFCALLLPRELRDYYNDYIDFTKKFDLLNTLSSFALVNIDEFDSITLSRQPQFKQLLSKSEVKLRPPYGKTFTQRRRYASFIATTNNQRPLSDPTGSRRFLCVRITDNIDTATPIDYPQLYAQLLAEVKANQCYWLTDEDTTELMRHNEQFRQIDSIEEMVCTLYRRPEPDDETVEMSAAEMVSRIRKRFPGVQANRSTFIKVGRVLSDMGCESRHALQGNVWKVSLQEN